MAQPYSRGKDLKKQIVATSIRRPSGLRPDAVLAGGAATATR
jgi:hypothetical protein